MTDEPTKVELSDEQLTNLAAILSANDGKEAA